MKEIAQKKTQKIAQKYGAKKNISFSMAGASQSKHSIREVLKKEQIWRKLCNGVCYSTLIFMIFTQKCKRYYLQ